MSYRFATFLLDLERYELRADGRAIPLQPRPFDVLRYLVEQAPRTVPKEELLDRVWSDVHTSEGVLTQAVSQLRRALSGVEGGEAVVETVRGRGYRIAVAVERCEPGAAPEATSSRTRRRAAAAALLLLLAGGVGFLALPPATLRPDAERSDVPEPESLNPRAVAVLPFEDPDEASAGYLGDALAEEVMSSLAGRPDVLVVARASAFAFKGQRADAQTIGRRLGVAYVLEGTVRRRGDRLRVTAQLVDVETGFSRWFETWERDVSDLFAVQQEIANEAAHTIALGAEAVAQPARARPPRDFPAYDAYLRGMAALRLRDRESLEQAVVHFEEALARDPEYADAWAGLAAALGEIWSQYSTETRSGPLKARADMAARRAFELDPESPEAMRLVASHLETAGDPAGGRALLERAHRLRPNSVEVKLTLGAHLMRRGDVAGGLRLFESAVRVDPFSAIAHLQLGRAYFYAGDTAAAIEHLERAATLSPEYARVQAQLAIVYRAMGRREDSREAFFRLLPAASRPFARVLARLLGDDRFARLLFAFGELRTGDPCIGRPEFAAHVYAAIGETDAMFTCLGREVARRHGWYLTVEPIYDPYREDPRFAELLETSGLAPQPAASASDS